MSYTGKKVLFSTARPGQAELLPSQANQSKSWPSLFELVRTQVGLASCQCLLCGLQEPNRKGCSGPLCQIATGLFRQRGRAGTDHVTSPSSLLSKAFLYLKVTCECTPHLVACAPGTRLPRSDLLFSRLEPVLSGDAFTQALHRLLPSEHCSASMSTKPRAEGAEH